MLALGWWTVASTLAPLTSCTQTVPPVFTAATHTRDPSNKSPSMPQSPQQLCTSRSRPLPAGRPRRGLRRLPARAGILPQASGRRDSFP